MTTLDAIWRLPQPHAVHEAWMQDGAKIILRRHGNSDGPRLLLSHGNGLAIDLYYPFWSLLAKECDLILYDLRNHGWNELSDIRQHNLPAFASDQIALFDAVDHFFGKKPKVGVFHSISALAVVLSPESASRYAGLFLFDPPICSRGKTYEEFELAAQRMSKMARCRTARFATRADMLELLPYSPTFQLVVPGTFDLVVRTTLRKSATDAGYELCCPPDYEAQVIQYAGDFAVLVDLDAIHCPIKVLGADPTFHYSYLPTFDLSHIAKVDYDFLPNATHFLQLEQPEVCAEEVLDFMDQLDLPYA